MKRTTLEWIAKAKEDFAVAEWVMKAPVGSPAAVGFHCQQCVEKYLNGVLAEFTIAFPKTHDLVALASALPTTTRDRLGEIGDLNLLQPYAVNSRYPGSSVTTADARDALQACRTLRSRLRETLGLPHL